MDINKLNHVTEVTQVPDANQNVQGDGSFKFTLASAITDADLQAKVDMLLSDITAQGNRIAQHMDIRDMKKYRGLIREFMNEVVFRSHKFSRENFLDRRGRHRVYRQGKAGAPICQLLSAGRRKRFAAVCKACKAGCAGRERRRYSRRGGTQRRLHCHGF